MSNLLEDYFGACAFAQANPVFFCQAAKQDPLSPVIAHAISIIARADRVWGDPSRAQEFRSELPKHGHSMPVVVEPRHVFPVYLKRHGVGMIAPLEIRPAREWDVSDAFGTFAVDDAHSATDGLFHLITRLDEAIARCIPGFFPLRWRRSYSIRMACPIHFDAIDGSSLQVPLLIAFLREAVRQPFSSTEETHLAFGDGPVFSTGELLDDGSFHWVEGLDRKLEAFRREYPGARQAVLTRRQRASLTSAQLDGLIVHEADSLDELLQLPDCSAALRRTGNSPHPTELDSLFDTAGRLSRSIRFSEAMSLIDALLPGIGDGPYGLRLILHKGLLLLHRGDFHNAISFIGRARDLMTTRPDITGAEDRANLATIAASALLDSAEPDEGLLTLAAVGDCAACTVAARVMMFGARSQLHRMLGNLDDAVRDAEQAVALADVGLASEAGRDRNYLIHALLKRASARADGRTADLDRAAELLAESFDRWAPRYDLSARAVHMGFCQQYAAEAARLRRVPHTPPSQPSWQGDWQHPRIFTLLSCARNHAHSPEKRLRYALAAAGESARQTPPQTANVFRLFSLLTEIYLAHLQSVPLQPLANRLVAWCLEQQTAGTPGWARRFGPALRALCDGASDEESVEAVLERLPYH